MTQTTQPACYYAPTLPSATGDTTLPLTARTPRESGRLTLWDIELMAALAASERSSAIATAENKFDLGKRKIHTAITAR